MMAAEDAVVTSARARKCENYQVKTGVKHN